MFKQLSRSPVIPWIGGTLIWAYMSLLSHTLRWKVEGIEHLRARWEGPEGKKGWVAATWHSRILLMPMVQIIFRPKWPKPPHPPTLMVSPSKDGEFTRRAGIWLGLHIIRGSASGRSDKSKRGVSAAREAMEVMNKGGGMVITIDGPRGPKYVAKPGPVLLAKFTQKPMLAFHFAVDRAWVLNTWDEFIIPKPFARVLLRVSRYMWVPANADEAAMQRHHQELQDALDRVRAFAEQNLRPLTRS